MLHGNAPPDFLNQGIFEIFRSRRSNRRRWRHEVNYGLARLAIKDHRRGNIHFCRK